MLNAWNEPPKLDRVNGRWRPLEPRNVSGIADAVRPVLPAMIASDSADLRAEGIELASRYGIKEVAPMLRKMLGDKSNAESSRSSALKALDGLNDEKLDDALAAAIKADSPTLRNAARSIVIRRDKSRGIGLMVEALRQGEPIEQQTAINALSIAGGPDSGKALMQHFDKLVAGDAAPETHLEILEAARASKWDKFRARFDKFEKSRDKNDHLAAYRESLAGGNAESGRSIFFGRSAASCRRCHKVGGNGGGVGPELTTIGKEKTREYLLESIVAPNKQIAKGFNTVVLVMESGRTYTGVVKEEDDETIKLMDANGAMVTVNKDEIDDQAPGLSGMPQDLIKHLSKSDLRDLVEYLAQQTMAAKEGGHK